MQESKRFLHFFYRFMKEKELEYRKALLLSFGFLLVAISLGLFLRISQVFPLTSFNYKHVLHGHSHITLLGWVYNAFYIAIVRYIIPEEKRKQGYRKLFWLTQTTIFASLISFPIQGYGLWSIIFSTLFLFCSYAFSRKVWKDTRRKNNTHIRFIRWGVLYLCISSIGPWALGVIMGMGLKETIWYPLSIYFYLHFFYNGFFVFSLFGLTIGELRKLPFSWTEIKAAKLFLWMNLSCAPAFLLSVLWTEPPVWVYFVAFVAALVQLWAIWLLYRLLKIYWPYLKEKHGAGLKALWRLVFVSLVLKVCLQLLSASPYLAEEIFNFKNYLVIAYIHLVMLGLITGFILAFFGYKYHLRAGGRLFLIGLFVFLIGFVATELLLFGQGLLFMLRSTMIPEFYPMLLLFSIAIPVGLSLIFLGEFRTVKIAKNEKTPTY